MYEAGSQKNTPVPLEIQTAGPIYAAELESRQIYIGSLYITDSSSDYFSHKITLLSTLQPRRVTSLTKHNW